MSRLLTTGVLTALILSAGCASRPTGGAGQETVVKVSYAEVVERDNIDFEEFTGRTVAVESVDVRPQVTGRIEKIFFKDGRVDKKGQPLYLIDDRTFKAELAQIKSNIQSAQARLEQTTSEMGRARRMRIGDAISREDFDKLTANKDEAQASLDANKAKADAAETNLSYTRINADITGMVSKTFVTEGNLVTANSTRLTNIVSVDTMRAEFDVDERTALRIGQRIRQGKFKSYLDAKLPVYLETQVEKGYPYAGIIDFVDNRLNPNTGTLLVRGLFPNTADDLKGLQPLRAGLFVRVRVPMGQAYRAVLINEQALVSDQDRKFVYVIGKDDKVEARPVRLGGMRDGLRIIEEGLHKGDRVVLTGLQRLRPGSTVAPEKIAMPAAAPAEVPAKVPASKS